MPEQSDGRFSSPVISIGVVVADFPRAVDFYTSVIGMNATGGFQVDAAFGKASGLTGDLPLGATISHMESEGGRVP